MSNSEALASLTATYTDSDASDEEGVQSASSPTLPPISSLKQSPGEENSSQSTNFFFPSLNETPTPTNHAGKLPNLVSYAEEKEDDEEDDKFGLHKSLRSRIGESASSTIDDDTSQDSIKDYTSALAKSFACDIKIPPEPPGRCSNQLQEKIGRWYEKKQRDGLNMNDTIQKRIDFRNPSIYEKLVVFCKIDELGTNYPPAIYDPHSWGPESFYEELAKTQKAEMDKRQKERTKVEFVSGTKKSSGGSSTTSDNNAADESKKRKSKWDVAQTVSVPTGMKTVVTQPPGIVPVTSTASGTKATVISAFGTITKKSKQ